MRTASDCKQAAGAIRLVRPSVPRPGGARGEKAWLIMQLERAAVWGGHDASRSGRTSSAPRHINGRRQRGKPFSPPGLCLMHALAGEASATNPPLWRTPVASAPKSPREGRYRAIIGHKWGAFWPSAGRWASENPEILGIRARRAGGRSAIERGNISNSAELSVTAADLAPPEPRAQRSMQRAQQSDPPAPQAGRLVLPMGRGAATSFRSTDDSCA